MAEDNREFEIFAKLTDPQLPIHKMGQQLLDTENNYNQWKYNRLDRIIKNDPNGDRATGLKEKMKLVQLHYIDCTIGTDSCHICELVSKLMEDYTCSEIMEDIEID